MSEKPNVKGITGEQLHASYDGIEAARRKAQLMNEFKMAPVEATETMGRAGAPHCGGSSFTADRVYEAMIAAAPAIPLTFTQEPVAWRWRNRDTDKWELIDYPMPEDAANCSTGFQQQALCLAPVAQAAPVGYMPRASIEGLQDGTSNMEGVFRSKGTQGVPVFTTPQQAPAPVAAEPVLHPMEPYVPDPVLTDEGLRRNDNRVYGIPEDARLEWEFIRNVLDTPNFYHYRIGKFVAWMDAHIAAPVAAEPPDLVAVLDDARKTRQAVPLKISEIVAHADNLSTQGYDGYWEFDIDSLVEFARAIEKARTV